MFRKRIGHLSLVLFIIFTCVIFANSSRDAVQSTSQSSVLVNLLKNIILFFKPGSDINNDSLTFFIRKLAHFSEFAIHALLLGIFILCRFEKLYNKIIYIAFAGLFTACCDEFIQLFPTGRSSQVTDIFIDFGGCLIGVLITVIIYEYLGKGRSSWNSHN